MDRSLLVDRERHVTWLTLNRPSRLNALDRGLRLALVDALAAAADDAATRVVVLTGAGERAFSSGQDLGESQALADAAEGGWIASWDRLFDALLHFPKPLVAALDGVTAGGGLEMAMHCDVRLATRRARLVMAEVDVGLPALTGSDWLSAHVGASRMLEIVLTGRPVTAGEAQRIGLVHHVVAPDALVARAREVSRLLAGKPRRALRSTLARLRQDRRRRIGDTKLMAQMTRYQAEAMASGEPQRLMQAFLAARAARAGGDAPRGGDGRAS